MKKLAVSLLVMFLSTHAFAQALNVYKFKIQSEAMLKKSCAYKGKNRANEFKIYIEQKFSDKITNLAVDIFVCPIMGKKFVRKSYVLPLPTSLFENLADAISEKSMNLEIPQKIKNGVVEKTLADFVNITLSKKTEQISEFSIRYKKDGAALLSLGLIKLTFANPNALVKSVNGFNIHNSIPLKSISVEVLDKNITLEADLIKIADVIDTPTQVADDEDKD